MKIVIGCPFCYTVVMYLDLNSGEIDNLANLSWNDLPESWRLGIEPFFAHGQAIAGSEVASSTLWSYTPTVTRVQLLSAAARGLTPADIPTAKAAPPPRSRWRRILASIGGGILAIFKYGAILLKLGTFKGALITMAISIIFYTWLFGPLFAVGFVILLGIHETGHWLMAKRLGIATSFPVFIPGLGALINMRQMPATVRQEAQMAIAGPAIGGLASFGVIGLAYLTHSGVWAALGYVGCFLNLFNLLPVTPLDGGRVMSAVNRWMNLVGLLLLLGYIGLTIFWFHNPYSLPILTIIALVGAFELFGRFRRGRYAPQYFDIPLQIRVAIASAWVLLLGFLSFGVLLSITQLAALHQIANIG